MTEDRVVQLPLLERARAMMPDLARRAKSDARACRVHAETIEGLRQSGLFRCLQPVRWGGLELDVQRFFAIVMSLSEADLSAAWVYAILAVDAWIIGLFPDEAAQDVWSDDRDALVSGSILPSGAARPYHDGFLLNGRWKYATGCEYGRWAILGAKILRDDQNEADYSLFLVPAAAYTILKTWDAAGLRATGSHDVVVSEAFVPRHRVLRFADCFELIGAEQRSPLYRLPVGQVLPNTLSSLSIGALTGFLRRFTAYVSSQDGARDGRMAEDWAVQQTCAEIAVTIDEMRAAMATTFDGFEADALEGQVSSLRDRVRSKYRSARNADRCAVLATRLFTYLGAAGLSEREPFGQILADILAARQHRANRVDQYGRNLGAAMLGLQPPTDLFV